MKAWRPIWSATQNLNGVLQTSHNSGLFQGLSSMGVGVPVDGEQPFHECRMSDRVRGICYYRKSWKGRVRMSTEGSKPPILHVIE